MVFAAVLAISFTSFFFSWKLDQSLMSRSDDGLSHFNGAAKNAMGYYGAQLAFKFVHNGFGLAAYALLPYVTLTGLFFLFDYRPFSLLRIAVHTILFTVWFSLFLGFALRWWPLLGGSFGFLVINRSKPPSVEWGRFSSSRPMPWPIRCSFLMPTLLQGSK